jgi:D-alanyl-D-alanine carboxypeptidase (penicillin-binding protein 5/6)
MRLIIYSLLFLFALMPLSAELPESRLADLVPMASRAVLMDVTSGRILYAKNPDEPIPPASLTKLMTIHLIFQDLEHKKYTLDQLVPVTSATDARAMPEGSSLMFLQAGQLVTVRELLTGLVVDSGNDAGLTLAVFSAGSQQAFVARMNAEAARLGMVHTIFYDSYGYDSRNKTTARELAEFCRYMITKHPYLLQLSAQKELAYPLAANWPPSYHGPVRTIWQKNRNELLWAYPGADGLKTGYITESGYNLAGTAVRGHQRLIAIVLGVQAPNSAVGSFLRTQAAKALFDYGFERYPLNELPVPLLPAVKAWYIVGDKVLVQPRTPVIYPLSDEERSEISVKVDLPDSVIGPFGADRAVGKLVWSLQGKPVTSVDLVAASPVQPASWWQDFLDAVTLFFRGIFGLPAPLNLSGPSSSN